MKRRLITVFACASACALLAASARADEIWLKDGSKIVGTITGYEDNAFKVTTAYGFAMVRKDSVLEILPGDAKSTTAKSAAAKPAEAPVLAPPEASAAPASTPVKPPSLVSAAQSAARAAAQPVSYATPMPPPEAPKATAAKSVPPPPVKPAEPLPAATPIAAAVPGPPVIQEFVRGNLYINQTYGFQMYKPPSWELVKDAGQALPNAIAALGTGDETTLLLVARDANPNARREKVDLGRELTATGVRARESKDSLDIQSAATSKTLSKVYENYRQQPASRTQVGGVSAVEQHARGVADGHDWSVVIYTFGRANDIFTVMGMTYADSDIIQIRENVIARMVSSLAFTPPPVR